MKQKTKVLLNAGLMALILAPLSMGQEDGKGIDESRHKIREEVRNIVRSAEGGELGHLFKRRELRYAVAEELAPILIQLAADVQPRQARRRAHPSDEGSHRDPGIQIIPEPRTNSILISGSEKMVDKICRWIDVLDVEVKPRGDDRRETATRAGEGDHDHEVRVRRETETFDFPGGKCVVRLRVIRGDDRKGCCEVDVEFEKIVEGNVARPGPREILEDRVIIMEKEGPHHGIEANLKPPVFVKKEADQSEKEVKKEKRKKKEKQKKNDNKNKKNKKKKNRPREKNGGA